MAAAWLPGAGGDWRVRLSAGADGDRESAVWNLPSDCLAADGRLPARLAWEARPWPNPFNPAVQARFRLGQAGEVEAVVYDLAGRRVATLLRGELAAGDHGVRWNGDGPEGPAAAGLYLLRIATPGAVLRHKLILVK